MSTFTSKMLNLQGFIIISTMITITGHIAFKSATVPCAQNSARLMSLLNYLCNSTDVELFGNRDACFGCFYRAASNAIGPLQLFALAQCATTYLAETNYGNCASALMATATTQQTTTLYEVCYTGYCDFVRCVRRVNSDRLIASCYDEAALTNDLETDDDHIRLFTNMSSCILAKARCNIYNPITGELNPTQRITQTQFLGKPFLLSSTQRNYNALQITPQGDIRIIAFPATTTVADYFCSTVTSLNQSVWLNANC